MTEPVIDRPPPPAGPPPTLRPPGAGAPPDAGGGGLGLRGRTAGMPNWAILLGAVAAGAVLLWWWKHRGSDNTSSNGSLSYVPGSIDDASEDASILAQLRDLQGAPSQPLPTPNPDAPPPTDTTTTPPPTPTPTPTPTAPTTTTATPGRAYTVRSGDNLNSIASRLGVAWGDLYWPNAATIEAAAKAHGLSSSRGGPNNSLGWWIYPNTVLVY